MTNASLHSSNDSGFANDPPPQPDVDYSDEETLMRVPLRYAPTAVTNSLILASSLGYTNGIVPISSSSESSPKTQSYLTFLVSLTYLTLLVDGTVLNVKFS